MANAIPLGDILAALGEGRQDKTISILPEAQIMELRAAVERYEQDCPFKVGDLVTPKANAPYRNKGSIHIVAEVFATSPIRGTMIPSGDWANYGKLDMRIICLADNGETVPHMVESWLFEPYTGEGATVQTEPEAAGIGGWIDCDGKECPVDPDATVVIKTRDLQEEYGTAKQFEWGKIRNAPEQEIISYRFSS